MQEGKVDVEGGDVELHFRYLINEPLEKNCGHPSIKPTVIVVDVLDKCGPDRSTQRKLLLRTLKDWSRLPTSCKLFVTSWDEHNIHQSLQNIDQHIGLPTGELVEPDGSNNISLFF